MDLGTRSQRSSQPGSASRGSRIRNWRHFRAIVPSYWRLPPSVVFCSDDGGRFAWNTAYCIRASNSGEWSEGGLSTLWAPRVFGGCVAGFGQRAKTLAQGAGESESCGWGADSHGKWGHYGRTLRWRAHPQCPKGRRGRSFVLSSFGRGLESPLRWITR